MIRLVRKREINSCKFRRQF